MIRKFSYPLLFVFTLAVLSSCAKDEDMTPVQPGETVTYKDMVFKFSFKAPKAWSVESQPGRRTTYYTSQGAITRFSKFTEGDYGARIEVGAEENTTKEIAADAYKNSIEGVTFTGPEATTLGGLPAVKYSYKVEGGDEDGYVGYRVFTDQDSVMTYFDAATFGDKRMAKYRPVFDLAEKSVTAAYVMKAGAPLDSTAVARMNEEMRPSDAMATYNGPNFSILYPDNFSAGGTGRGVAIKGERNDATIQVDVLPSKGTDLAKIVDENAKQVYKGAPVSNATVGGQAGKVVNYSFDASVRSRAYFTLKGTNLYRITVNWPVAMDAAYRPAFERSVASFKIK